MSIQLQTIDEIEANIAGNKVAIETAKALDRLLANKDFQRVVIKGYLMEEAVRLVHLRADPAFQTPEKQLAILTQIDGIGAVKSYLDLVHFKARQAEKAIEQDEATIDDIRAEAEE